MSDNSDRNSDWLDELYQTDNDAGPPADLDARIRAAARDAHGARPWYQRTAALASAATLVLAAGLASLWLDGSPEQSAVTISPPPMPASETLADSAALVSDTAQPEETARAAAPMALQKSAGYSNDQLADPGPDSCSAIELIATGAAGAYALCHQDGEAVVTHPGCTPPYPVSDAKVEADEQTDDLIVLIDGQRSRLRCDSQANRWLLMPVTDQN